MGTTSGDGFAAFLGIVAATVVVFLVIIGFGWIASFEKTSGGEVAVVRNGGLFDNNKIRQFIPRASDMTSVGLWSQVHKYPAQQRFYKISSRAKESDTGLVDQVSVPSSDGITLDLEGTVYFNLNTEEKTIKEFDDRFGSGNRTFAGKHVYDGEDGFAAWLNTIFRPVIDNTLRKEIGNVTCADIYPSCALVQNQGNVQKVDSGQGRKNNQKISEIEAAVNTALAADINSQLGGDYIKNIKFTLVRALPTGRVQNAIDEAQASFGNVSRAQAKLKSADLEAQANKKRQEGYANCPACARIDALKAIPPNITTYAPGGGFAVTGR